MAQLVQETKHLAVQLHLRVIDLALHRRHGTQQHSLRWRRPGSGGAHVAWKQVPDVLVGCSPHVCDRYLAFTDRARALNDEEKRARAELRRARAARDMRYPVR
ncbi:MAG TPA: hypothetical protein VFP68_00515 [Burkholderiaceae bacterium]|nr:hypothetical protein [Burkholderiaceae bacterium]